MPYVQLRGKILRGELIGEGRGKRYVAYFSDGFELLELVWFQGWRWIQNKFNANTEYVVFGKPTEFRGKYSISHPEVEIVSEDNIKLNSALQSVYPSTESLKNKGLDSNGLRKIMGTLISQLNKHVTETLPNYLLEEKN